jgi:hypothetical protein
MTSRLITAMLVALLVAATAVAASARPATAATQRAPLGVGTTLAPGASSANASGKHLAGPHRLRQRVAGASAKDQIPGPLVDNGGPVETKPTVYVDYWGWTSDPSGEQPYLESFLSSIGGTRWAATVGQYGSGNPAHLLAGTWSDTTNPIPATPSDQDIYNEGLAAAAHFGVADSLDVQVVVATPTGHSTQAFGNQYCAYHGQLTGKSYTSTTYTYLPYMTDAGQNCGAGVVNGPGGSLDGVSIVEGHELAETMTDPWLNAWIDANGWEIGDKCAWYNLADVTTSSGSFAVQPLWSNDANGCALYPAVTVALNPASILADGTSRSAATASVVDAQGNPVTNESVTFSTGGDVTFGPVTNHGDGTYSAAVTASKTVGSQTVMATANTNGNHGTEGLTETAPGGRYVPLPPARIADTRPGSGQPNAGQTLGQQSSVDVQVTGAGGVPTSGVLSFYLNVTETDATAPSYLTVYPSGQARPNASNLNFDAGETHPNLVQVPVGPDGKVTVFNAAGSVDVVVDVEGYAAAPGAAGDLFQALAPSRLVDTRTGSGSQGAGSPLGAQQAMAFQATGQGGVPPSGVGAVVLNVTATDATAPISYLTAYPAGQARPTASNLNFRAGETVANRVVVPVGAGGQVSVYNAVGSTDVVVDVNGWFADSTSASGVALHPLAPTRVFDSRAGSGLPGAGQTPGPSSVTAVQVAGAGGVPPMAGPGAPTAVVLNVTVTDTTAASYFTVFPSDSSVVPLASDLNWSPGLTIPNLVVAKVGADGKVYAFNAAGNADVVVDVLGYYS